MSDINELFRKDPLTLTREDLTDIVQHYRNARAQFNLGDKKAGAPTKKVGSKKSRSVADLFEEASE